VCQGALKFPRSLDLPRSERFRRTSRRCCTIAHGRFHGSVMDMAATAVTVLDDCGNAMDLPHPDLRDICARSRLLDQPKAEDRMRPGRDLGYLRCTKSGSGAPA
jgi:hypothetical protein